ncbi:heat shock protein Hsp20 [Halodesulfurarchaeum formicicum]|uniref:Heat shock protein Hsp20 n=1 Tax=Halodesulfurarchaeum formicicum TaxID=1873524 RepID=A0A1D8S2M5_9EURY|nr:Hsp20/alpha crystallin family protein [Halodesulfurarchaeum formicicum]AOW79612.1 heat shock protein Hsp20 [Halodesulfurarchaeum formicicum]APE94863.1 heat shock protein Hsp20 [Halodesulfurarchaeum formicicum]
MDMIREALATLPDAVFADLLESPTSYRLILDVPGVDRSGLDLEATEHHLELRATRTKQVPEGFEYHTDARSMTLSATIPMPTDADPEAASATLENGVLTIDVPRHEESGRSIPIEG